VPVRVVTGPTRDAILQAVNLAAQQARAVTLQCARPVPVDAKLSLLWGPGIATPSGIATTAARRLVYLVRPPFTASFNCERENARAHCLPVRPLRLEFSSPVPRRWAEQIRLSAPDSVHKPKIEQQRGETVEQLVALGPATTSGGGTGGGAALRRFLYFFGRNHGVGTAPDSNAASASGPEEGVSAVEFAAPLPEHAQVRIELPPGLVDDAGRPLGNAALFPLVTRMADAPALAKLPAATLGILDNASGAPMHDVSSASWAAPVWRRVIDEAQRRGLGADGGRPLPPRLESRRVVFQRDLEPARDEWFLPGTAQSHVRLASLSGQAPRPILSPQDGVVLALDPYIPSAAQKLRFAAVDCARGGTFWQLDGQRLGAAQDVDWSLRPGRHWLALVGADRHALDEVQFEVRGAERLASDAL
jgi:hypothetical protein